MIRVETILNELKKTIFGQDEYLKQLAVTGYKHQLKNELINKGRAPIDTNLLVIGPSGCGKTFAVRRLAELLDIPFYEINCANITEVGYKGTQDIEMALGGMVNTLRKESENAIVYLDEFDKVLDVNLLHDGNGKAIQQNFLKILEPNEITVPISYGSKNSSTIKLNTSGMTFIATGTFEIIKDHKRKNGGNKMGFNSIDNKEKNIILDEDDLVKGGYMPELIGRFSSLININQLTKDDFYNIIKKGNKSALKNYEMMLEDQGVELCINDRVYKEIANIAYNNVTGARGINKILNKVLEECLCDVSNDSSISKVTIGYSKNQFKTDYERDSKKKKMFIENIVYADKLISIEEIRKFIYQNLSFRDINNKLSTRAEIHFDEVLENFDGPDVALNNLISVLERYRENIDHNAALLNNNRCADDIIDNKNETEYLVLLMDVYKDLLNKYSDIKDSEWEPW